MLEDRAPDRIAVNRDVGASNGSAASGGSHLTGRHFVIVGGGRLTVAVARTFLNRDARLTIIVPKEERRAVEDAIGRGDGTGVARVVPCQSSLGTTLERYNDDDLECVLALADDSEFNVKVAVTAKRLDKPVVLRAFDPTLAEAVEANIDHVRRAYSMAHLSAPFFVAAALLEPPPEDGSGFGGAQASQNVLTMRAGAGYAVVCQLRVPPPVSTRIRWLSSGARHRLANSTPEAMARRGCHVLARRTDSGWRVLRGPPNGEDPTLGAELRPGEEILLGGPLNDVFNVLRHNSFRPSANESQDSSDLIVRNLGQRFRSWSQRVVWTRLEKAWPQVSAAWVKLLLIAFVVLTAVILIVPRGDAADRVYSWVSTALGNTQSVAHVSKTTELILAIGLLAGGVAFGLAICLGAAVLIERRMTELMERRVKRLSGHIIVVGLNEVSFRVTELLCELKIPCVVVDPHPETDDAAAIRYGSLLNYRAPVVRGELSQLLKRTRIDRALALIGCSEDNLANLEACLRANPRRPHRVRAVARVFDEEDVARYLRDWGVEPFAAVDKAADAFVEGALHETVVRPFRISGAASEFCGIRLPRDAAISKHEWRELVEQGVHAIARIGPEAAAQRTPYVVDAIREGEHAILIGPAQAMEGLLERLERGIPKTVAARTA